MKFKKCVAFVKEYLRDLGLLHIYDSSKVYAFYKKQNEAVIQPYKFSFEVVDYLINSHETG